MVYLQFIAALVHSVAWPVSAIVLAALFRIPLKELLLKLNRFQYGNVEIDFGRELAQIESYAKTLDLRPSTRPKSAAKLRTAEQTLDDAARLIDDFPEPALALAWTAIEEELMSAIMRLAASADYPPYNSSLKNMKLLREQGYIDGQIYQLLDRMRNLRDAAVHGGAVTTIGSDEAREFVSLAGAVLERLKRITRGDPNEA